MKGLLAKLIDRLLKKSEQLTGDLDQSVDGNDPLKKKIDSLLEKRDRLKGAITMAQQEPANSATSGQANSTVESQPISQSAVKVAATANTVKKTKPAKARNK